MALGFMRQASGVEHVHLNASASVNVVDVSGAGDTVIATAALMLAAGE